MNPNLNYAQVVRGRGDMGHAPGIIDVRDFAIIIDAIGLIQDTPQWAQCNGQLGMLNWFRRYLDWLITSPMRTALDYILPAALNPQLGPYQQINPPRPEQIVDELYLAASRYHEPAYLQAAQKILGDDAATHLTNLLYAAPTTS